MVYRGLICPLGLIVCSFLLFSCGGIGRGSLVDAGGCVVVSGSVCSSGEVKATVSADTVAPAVSGDGGVDGIAGATGIVVPGVTPWQLAAGLYDDPASLFVPTGVAISGRQAVIKGYYFSSSGEEFPREIYCDLDDAGRIVCAVVFQEPESVSVVER